VFSSVVSTVSYVGCRWGRCNLVSRSCLAIPCSSTGNVGFQFRGGCSYSHFRRTHTLLALTHPVWSRCGIRLRSSGILFRPDRITPGVVLLRYPASLRRYPSSSLSCHARRGLVVVSFFAVAVSFFALIVSRPAWSGCGILLRCGGILLRPYRVTPGMVSLWYPSSLWRYPSSP